VDNNTAFAPTYLCDIRDWQKTNMKEYSPGYFDIITASPPCTEYSRANTSGVRNLKLADSLVRSAIEIISYLKPRHWFIENPVGLLATRPFMQKMTPFMMTCTYCKYGAPFRKATNIWASFAQPDLLKVCDKRHPCHHMARCGKHPQVAQSGPSGSTPGSGSALAVYPLPERLVRTLISAALSPTLCMAITSHTPNSSTSSPASPNPPPPLISPDSVLIAVSDTAIPDQPPNPASDYSIDPIVPMEPSSTQPKSGSGDIGYPLLIHNIWTSNPSNTWTFNH
jgi:hypothetical protein